MTETNESVNVNGNSKKAASFLKHFRAEGYHNLVAIDPVSEAVTGITRPSQHPDLIAFIEKYNGKRNLYYSVNEPKPNAPDDKLKKHDIAKVHGVWLDADPKKDLPLDSERERLAKFATDLKTGQNPPTYITDSGGGIQAFWLYEKPMDATKDNVVKAESLSRGLAEQYGTDFVQNIDRIMRIPFTVNIPSEKKVKAGRTRTVASVIHAASPSGKRYPDMPFITPSFKAEQEDKFEHTEVDMDVIKQPLSDDLINRLKDTLRRDRKAHDLYYGIIEKPSRSEYDFTLTQQLVWDGYNIQDVAHILYHYTWGKNKDLTKREVIRTYNRVDNPFEGLDADYVAKIERQVNPILAARAAGKPLAEDLKPRIMSVWLHEMDWRYSGRPIYKNFLYEKAITVIYGQSNVGKSFVASDIAGHVALALNWGSFKYKPKNKDGTTRPIGVLYIAAEAAGSFGKRGKALLKRLKRDKIPFRTIGVPLQFAKDRVDTERVVKEIEMLKAELDFEVGLVIVDTLATTFQGGNENASEDMGMYISNMKYIQHHCDTGVLIVHHAGKDQAAGARGHSSLRAATDTEIEVLSEKKGERYHRCIRTRKQREGENDIVIKFGLMVVELGKDEDGDPIDTCHVVLETDDEFESIVPMDELEPGEAIVLRVDKIWDSLPNDKKTKIKEKITETQVKGLLYNDISKNLGVLVGENDVFNYNELAFMQKPKSGDNCLTRYREYKKTLESKENVSGISNQDLDFIQ